MAHDPFHDLRNFRRANENATMIAFFIEQVRSQSIFQNNNIVARNKIF